MGDISNYYNVIVQYPKDIVSDIGQAEKDRPEEQTAELEEQPVESGVADNESLEENLGRNIDVSV